MRLLFDTNVVISAEPTSPTDLEARTSEAAELIGLANQSSTAILLHTRSLEELAGDTNAARRDLRAVLLRKYAELDTPPTPTPALTAAMGSPVIGTHDWIDLQLLAAVERNAVHYFVTDDQPLLKKAARAGFADRVLTVPDAIAMLRRLFDEQPPSLPLVESVKAHQLDRDDPIWASFRIDYAGFDAWLKNCMAEGRECRIVRAVGDDPYAGVAILKKENALPSGYKGRVLKICSFKISEQYSGRRYGELLLKSAFEHASHNDYDAAYLEVLEKHGGLIGLLEDFGFVDQGSKPGRPEEHYYEKRFRPSSDDASILPSLEFHVRFGPPVFMVTPDRTFIVPIEPRYHKKLFPEFELREQPQQRLFAVDFPFGNSLRKAYLSRSGIRQLQAGDTLLFYRSWKNQLIGVVGVIEDTIVSKDPHEVAMRVGNRTVYTLAEIEAMAGDREILGILFRQATMLDDPISYEELQGERAVLRAPQSISRVRPEAHAWLTRRLSA